MRPGTRKVLTALAVFGAVWLGLRYLLPLFFPFVLGAGLALAAEPMVSFLYKKAHVPRPVSAGIGVSMAFCFLAMVVLMLCAFVLRELRVLSGILPDLTETARSGVSLVRHWLLDLASHTPQSIQPLLQRNVDSLFTDGAALVEKGSGWLLGLAGNLLSHVPDSALSIGTAVISGYMISAKLPGIRVWLLARIPKERLEAVRRTLGRVRTAVGGWLFAQLKLSMVTWLILTAAFLLLRIRYAPLWAGAVALVDALPVLGTGTVLIPWAVISLLQQNTARALGLAGTYLTVTLLRSVLEPKFLGRHLGLDPLVTLMAMYAGYKIWGIGGMILAPLIAVTAIQLVPERKLDG